MHKFIKNKILLFYIFLANNSISFAKVAVTNNKLNKKSKEIKSNEGIDQDQNTEENNQSQEAISEEKNDDVNVGSLGLNLRNNTIKGRTIFTNNNNVESSEIDALEKENRMLELEMKKKILTLELAKKNKELAEFEKRNKECEEEERISKQIKKIQQELELIKANESLFVAKQYDDEKSREELKKHLEIKKREQELDLEIEMLNKERRLKNMKEEMLDDSNIEYPDEPLLKNGTLVLSDRQIKMGMFVNDELAERIEHDIDYFNNKNSKQPIFLIIDVCYGGDVGAGSRILSKIQNSQAPVYVVVKKFAASMAAIITTLAPRSFCFENARILHHQPLKTYFFESLNVREHRERLAEIEDTWKRFMGPVAKKMGITLDVFMKKMYEKNSNGDWIVYGDEAKKIKWVDHTITNIRDTSINKKFKKDESKKFSLRDFLKQQREFSITDFYYMYIPENLTED